MGYSVSLGVLNAADFGVPQVRERAIFIASRDEALPLPPPTHCDLAEGVLPLTSCAAWTTVRDANSDLPPPPIGEDALASAGLEAYPVGTLSGFAARMRSHNAFPNGHVKRSYARRIVQLIAEMRPGETWDAASARMRVRYDDIISSVAAESGESQSVVKQRLVAQNQVLAAFYKDYYWSAYTRLAWDRPALTITANANFLGSGRFTHPSENRGITVREAARLQSFDDDFYFETTEQSESRNISIGIAMDMIGEAVPPVLGQAIANQIVARLDDYALSSEGKEKTLSPQD
jgi:DNA (cytosine-5)-methyltransferase 1